MRITLQSNRVALRKNQLLRMDDAAGTRLVCTHGALWITQDRDLDDHFIEGGQSLVLERPGLAIVSATVESGLRIETPARQPGRLNRWAQALLRAWLPLGTVRARMSLQSVTRR